MDTAPTLKAKPAGRLQHIDFAKGILIYLMVISHIHYMGAYPVQMASFFTALHAFHMPAFLAFNGLLINFDRPIGQQFKNLLRGLVIPYILFEFLYITLLFLAGKTGFKFANAIDDYSLRNVAGYVFVYPIGAYWYLHTLIIGLAITYVINKIFLNKMAIIVACAITFWLMGYVISGFNFAESIFIIFGLFLNLYGIRLIGSWLSLVAMGIIFYVNLPYLPGFSMAGLPLSCLAISGLFWIYGAFLPNKLGLWIKKYFVFTGRNTLIIVLIHPIFLNVLKPASKYMLMADPSGISNLIIVTVITVVFCCYCSRLMDKTGVSTLLFGKNIYVPAHA